MLGSCHRAPLPPTPPSVCLQASGALCTAGELSLPIWAAWHTGLPRIDSTPLFATDTHTHTHAWTFTPACANKMHIYPGPDPYGRSVTKQAFYFKDFFFYSNRFAFVPSYFILNWILWVETKALQPSKIYTVFYILQRRSKLSIGRIIIQVVKKHHRTSVQIKGHSCEELVFIYHLFFDPSQSYTYFFLQSPWETWPSLHLWLLFHFQNSPFNV